MPDLGWIVAAVVVLAIAFVAYVKLSERYRRRTGTGEWEKYGPNPNAERIEEVNRPLRLYFGGARDMLAQHPFDARRQWEEADELGEPRAITGLGIIAWSAGRKDDAKTLWARASGHGEVPAKILLRLKKSSGAGMTRDEFIRYFLQVETAAFGAVDPHPFEAVAHAARFFGYAEYAEPIAARAREARAPRTIY